MVSKKELMKRIEKLENRLLQLENMHAYIYSTNYYNNTRTLSTIPSESYTYDGKEGSYYGRQLTADELKTRCEHPMTKERCAWTKEVPNVTHEELARFVLDGTPIKRKHEDKVTYTTIYEPGTKTEVVETKLGNFCFQDNFKG